MLPAETESVVDALRAAGAKVTAPRTQVLRVLRAAPAPLSHREVLERIGDAAIDRVTVYRVLDWLVECGLAGKAADGQGVFRFAARESDATRAHDTHVHFRCTRCGGLFCLKDAPPPRPRLPRGFRLSSMSVDIQGECARCAAAH